MEPETKVEVEEKPQATSGMKKNQWIFLAAALILIGGYKLMKSKSANEAVPSPAPAETVETISPSAVVAKEKTVVLSIQNSSGESGTATLTEVDGKVVITLDLTGAPASVTQPAHIHAGSCAAIGAVVYPLTSPVDGKSKTTLAVTMDELLQGLPLALNVHKSAAQPNVYVTCGDLVAN